jgi:hypothetical protein
MIRRTLPLLAMTVACACASAPSARASESTPAAGALHVGHLDCGGASLTASTVFREVPDQDRQVVAQTMTVTAPGAKTASPLKIEARPFRQPFLRDTPVLDASATGWACVTSTSQRSYVYVVMTCTESPLRPACAGPKREWVRVYDLRGRALNAGFPHDAGPREEALMKRLGLDHVEDSGVSLSDPRE